MKFKSGVFSLCLLVILAITSCASVKKVTYLQGPQGAAGGKNLSGRTYHSLAEERVIRIQADDVLSIVVNAPNADPEVVADFNLPATPKVTVTGATNQGEGQATYRVNKAGHIDFPVLGVINVEGMTQDELEYYLKQMLRGYLKEEPVVTVSVGFSISILGEVNNPGRYGAGNRLNVLEALALAGDMTIYGKRDDVQIVHTAPDGTMNVVTVDVTKADLMKSPYFYLQQGDMLIVNPNRAKAASTNVGSMDSFWLSAVSVIASVLSMVVVVLVK
ncbi:MAG: polysaccharide biosynthesis/export family protein [Candidatus Symbiothrix sp.]|jgi:polysaccharide export outer membrane protein|nr:polysaccharide biosynthesis/export family protein [Candidatus Symbiothrix sp.]